MVQNPEARCLTKKKKQHIIPVLDQAHSPPVQYRTELKKMYYLFSKPSVNKLQNVTQFFASRSPS